MVKVLNYEFRIASVRRVDTVFHCLENLFKFDGKDRDIFKLGLDAWNAFSDLIRALLKIRSLNLFFFFCILSLN